MAAPVASAEPSPNGRTVPSAEDFTLFADRETVAKLAPALREKFAGDPALQSPGTAPNYGQWLLPHVMTLQGLVTSISRVYRISDEALNDSFDNARFMEYDVGIRECVEARIRDSVLLDWHIDPEDELDPNQVLICGELTKIVRSIERWQQFQETLSWALWYGRNAVSLKMGWKQVNGQWYCMPTGDGSHPGWLPVHGDKLVFRLMDDRLDHPQNQVGIRVGQTYHAGDRINKQSHDLMEGGRNGEFWKVEPTDRGLAYFLDDNEAKQLVIHKYQIQDAAFERPIDAGRIHGVGIRSVLYWEWYMEKEALRWLMEFVERSAFGLELWYYPLGNEKARADTETAIKKRVGPYRNALLVPVPPEDGGPGKQYGVDHIETGAQGADLILSIIEKYFGHRRKRYILGQILTTEAEATGLGGNLASIHLLSYRSIIRYDAKNRDETTTQFINNLKSWNFPGNGHWRARYVTESEPVEADTKLAALQAAQNMGAPISVRQIYEAAGITPPQPDDVLAMPAAQMAAAMGGPDGGGGPPADDDQSVAPETDEGPESPEQFSLASRFNGWADRMLGGTHNNRLRSMWEGSRWSKPTVQQLKDRYSDKDLRNRIDLAAKTTHTDPSRGQRQAGNYRKGKVSIHGLDVVIENPKGSYRKYQFEGKKGKSELHSHYGYISGTEGTDDGQLDCFIGPDPESDLVYIVDQVNPRTGEFDELKVLIGWYCTDEAKEGYLANYEKGWKGLGRLTMLTMPQFKEWLKKGNQKRSMVGQKAFYSEQDQYSEELSRLLAGSGELPEIGNEKSTRSGNIIRHVSPHGSYRYVYHHQGEPVSALQIASRDGETGTISRVYTSPEHRRKGFASKLLDHARSEFGEIRHSSPEHQSDDARAWIKKVHSQESQVPEEKHQYSETDLYSEFAPHDEWRNMEASPEHVYHATTVENAHDIAHTRLHTHGPSYGTDQSHWPDGSIKKRTYFADSPAGTWHFAPEHGEPALLRMKRSAAKIQTERHTGDLYTEGHVHPRHLEIATKGGGWRPLEHLKEPETDTYSDLVQRELDGPSFHQGEWF